MKQTKVSEWVRVITVPVAPSEEEEEDAVRGGEEGAARRWAGAQEKQIQVSELTQEINVLLAQVDIILKDAKPTVGKFQFSEFEVSAGITASGKVSLLGFGGEAGLNGGLKFVFKRT